jgi:ABC-type oligopeptide transport system substrate-binding subunit
MHPPKNFYHDVFICERRDKMMRRSVIVTVIFVLVMALTSCGSKNNSAVSNKTPVNNISSTSPKVNVTKSVKSIDDTMKSVEKAVDSLEDAVDINLDNL